MDALILMGSLCHLHMEETADTEDLLTLFISTINNQISLLKADHS